MAKQILIVILNFIFLFDNIFNFYGKISEFEIDFIYKTMFEIHNGSLKLLLIFDL